MLQKSLNVLQCIEALETRVALLVKQQNVMLEEQQNTYRKKLDCSQEFQEFQEKLEQELKNINKCQEMIKSRQELIFTKQDQF